MEELSHHVAASQDDDLLTIHLLALGDERVDGSLPGDQAIGGHSERIEASDAAIQAGRGLSVDGSLRLALGWACHEKTMTEALASRSTVGQAVGILMERYGLDPDCGFLPT